MRRHDRVEEEEDSVNGRTSACEWARLEIRLSEVSIEVLERIVVDSVAKVMVNGG